MEKNVIEKRRSFIINFIYFALIIGTFYFLVNYAMGYIFPFVFASVLAVVLQTPVRFIVRKLHLKAHGPVSIILVMLIVSAVVIGLFFAGKRIVEEVSDLVYYVTHRFDSVADFVTEMRGYLNGVVSKLPESLQDKINTALDKVVNNPSSAGSMIDFEMLSGPLAGAWNVVKEIPSILLTTLVTIISCVFMTAEYDKIKELILSYCSEEKGNKIIEAKRVVTKGVGKLVKAYATIMFITFTEVFLGLYLMKLIGVYNGGYIAVIAFVVCVVDIVPVLGTGTVIIPWAVYSFVTGKIAFGIGLIILYAVITVLRQAIEPKLVANQVGLPAIVTIMAMFLGARLFGVFGVVLLPFTVIVIKLMLDEGVIGNKKTVSVAADAEKSKEVAE